MKTFLNNENRSSKLQSFKKILACVLTLETVVFSATSKHLLHVFVTLSRLACFLLDIDDCVDVFCDNGRRQAVDTGKSCECQCVPGFTGENCETGQFSVVKIRRWTGVSYKAVQN